VPAVVFATACGGSDDASSTSSAGVEAPESAFPDKPATGSVVKIGLINPEGGPAVSLPDGRLTAQAAVDYANAHLGGIAGHKIEVVNCANKEDPASARDCANQMVEANVSAVVVPNTGQGESMVPIITGAGIPYLSQTATNTVELTHSDTYSLTGGPAGRFESMAAYSKEQGFSKVTAFINDAGSLVETVDTLGGEAYRKRGMEFDVVAIPLGSPDSTPQVSSGLSGDVDAVAILGDGPMCTSVMNAMVSLGADQAMLLGAGCTTPANIEAVGDAMNGAQIFNTSDISSDDPDSVLYRSVVKRYAPDADADGLAFAGYQSMLGLIRLSQGLEGDPTGPNISKAIATAKDTLLPLGHGITMNCDGTADSRFPTICSMQGLVTTWDDGQPADVRLAN
jgi:branched-chain amino acid transport system substrate-binding protein